MQGRGAGPHERNDEEHSVFAAELFQRKHSCLGHGIHAVAIGVGFACPVQHGAALQTAIFVPEFDPCALRRNQTPHDFSVVFAIARIRMLQRLTHAW